jgi:hypothetical protein
LPRTACARDRLGRAERAEQPIDVAADPLEQGAGCRGSATRVSRRRRDACRSAAVAAELDLFDARLRSLKPRLALLLQPVALAVELDRFVQRRLAAFQLANDLLEPLQRGLEGELADIVACSDMA